MSVTGRGRFTPGLRRRPKKTRGLECTCPGFSRFFNLKPTFRREAAASHGPWAGVGRGVRLRLRGGWRCMSLARPCRCHLRNGRGQQSVRCQVCHNPYADPPKPTHIKGRTQVHSTSSYAWGLGQALGERAYLRRSAPSLKASAATRMLGAAAATAACTAVTASTDTHIPEAALSCCHQAMLVSSHIGRQRTALVHARKLAGWVASSASAASASAASP